MNTLKLYLRTQNLRQKWEFFADSLSSAFWLGMLDKHQLHQLDDHYYSTWEMYQSEEHNTRGLNQWEQQLLDRYFRDVHSFIVPGAGSGREIIALAKAGKLAQGYECNSRLVENGKKLIKKLNLNCKLSLAERDSCPKGEKTYEAALIGWSAYMHIAGKKERIEFLNQVRANLRPGARVLMSFFSRADTAPSFKWIFRGAKIVSKMKNNSRIPEQGDLLSPNFLHYFSKEEIQEELKQGGMKLLEFSNPGPGVAIAEII